MNDSSGVCKTLGNVTESKMGAEEVQKGDFQRCGFAGSGGSV